ncbi:MAG: hypothetical protein QXM92_00585 [Candidatus Anstonellales archaeon]
MVYDGHSSRLADNAQTLNGNVPITRHLVKPGGYILLLTDQMIDESLDGYDTNAYVLQVIASNPLVMRIQDNPINPNTTEGPGLLTETGIDPTATTSVLSIPRTLPYNIYHFAIHLATSTAAIAPITLKMGLFYPAGNAVNGYSADVPPKNDLSEVFAGIPAPYTATDFTQTSSYPLPTTITELVSIPMHDILFAVRNEGTSAVTPVYNIFGAGYLIRVIKDPILQEHVIIHKHPHVIKYGSWRPFAISFPTEWGKPIRLGNLLDRLELREHRMHISTSQSIVEA